MDKLPSLHESELQPWLDKPEMIRACAQQLQKDLAPYAIQITFSGDIHEAYAEMFFQLKQALAKLFTQNSSLQEILYRVDVQESLIQKVAQENEDITSSLTRLILWRELQKVVTRYLLSQQMGEIEGDYTP